MNRHDLIAKINRCYDEDQFEQALAGLDQLIEIDGKTENLLDFRFDLLMRLKRYPEAFTAAVELEDIAARKSPWNCLKVAEACLGQGQNAEALSWMEKAVVERYFKRCDVFEEPLYATLKNEPRFIQLIEKARENIGLEKPVQDFTVRLLDGEEVTLSLLKGQVVLLDFWASDCPPCVRDMPALIDLYARFKDQGFEVIGISLDSRVAEAQKYVADHHLPWKVCCSGKAFFDDLAERFKIEAIPSTWLIDRQGILRFYQLRGQAMEDAIQLLLAEKSLERRCRGDYCTF